MKTRSSPALEILHKLAATAGLEDCETVSKPDLYERLKVRDLRTKRHLSTQEPKAPYLTRPLNTNFSSTTGAFRHRPAQARCKQREHGLPQAATATRHRLRLRRACSDTACFDIVLALLVGLSRCFYCCIVVVVVVVVHGCGRVIFVPDKQLQQLQEKQESSGGQGER